MIKSVHLKNFQSHKDSLFEFPDGITSLTGTSNSGKTAVLRALGWVFYNRPTGEAFVSYWARDDKGKQTAATEVKVTFSDGTTVERIRSKTENIYKLNGLSLEAIGQSVPEQIQKACNVSEVNFQTQMESPFLLSESAGEVARFFNKLIHLDIIDSYLSLAESKKRKSKAERETVKDNLDRTQKELSQYEWTDKAAKLIDAISSLQEKYTPLMEQQRYLGMDIDNVKRLYGVLRQTEVLSSAENLLMKIAVLSEKAQAKDSEVASLQSTILSYEKYASLVEAIPDMEYAGKLVNRIGKLLELRNETKQDMSILDTNVVAYQTNESIINKAVNDNKELTALLPKACPLCGGAL